MQSPLTDLLGNRVFWASFVSWVVAQFLKTMLTYARTRKMDLSYFVASGGMPSSHSALVMGLATAVARVQGPGSTTFAIAAVFAGVVMYDAAGVRRAVSLQAHILNRMVDDFFHKRGIDDQRLSELIGHTPIEVLGGALLGITSGLALTV